ncbi:MAG: putative ferredoxin [Homoserinimonas sp.]|nr:putative ferredoxin [Homoserinimonas sp.]
MDQNWTVTADRIACQGYGNCVIKSPQYFDLDDDGLVFITRDGVDPDADQQAAAVDPADVQEVQEAVRSCPVSALTMVATS